MKLHLDKGVGDELTLYDALLYDLFEFEQTILGPEETLAYRDRFIAVAKDSPQDADASVELIRSSPIVSRLLESGEFGRGLMNGRRAFNMASLLELSIRQAKGLLGRQ